MNILKNIKYSKNFRELNFWIFEWRHYTNIALQQPEIYDDKSYFKYDLRLISGESMSDLILRVKQWLNDFEKIKWNILLITHWSVIRALYSILNKIDYNEVYSSEDIDIIKYHKFIINN
jgi:broad specificity phosphatase PhoE